MRAKHADNIELRARDWLCNKKTARRTAKTFLVGECLVGLPNFGNLRLGDRARGPSPMDRSESSACIAFLHLLRKSRYAGVRRTVMAGHVPATSRDGLSLRMAGTCPAMTVGQHAAGIFTLSWCPRAGQGTALKFFLRRPRCELGNTPHIHPFEVIIDSDGQWHEGSSEHSCN